jgi:hypothetical protein
VFAKATEAGAAFRWSVSHLHALSLAFTCGAPNRRHDARYRAARGVHSLISYSRYSHPHADRGHAGVSLLAVKFDVWLRASPASHMVFTSSSR